MPASCLLSAAFLLVLALLSAVPSQAKSYVFFQGTQYPLAVYILKGLQPGPTVMVQGGIQGDEVSGFLTAETLSRAHVRRGTLIVVPRANIPSISRRVRAVNVDLNRRFDQPYDDYYEDALARVIRLLLARSDAFIHLHEGSGFYSPTWINAERNPKRWGQSVIIDAGIYQKTLHLSNMVESVLTRLNPHVRPASYRFALFNTETFAPNSPYGPEMRKSLTCYALKEHRIPALAIEVSKDIRPLDWKVREQLRAAVMFLEKFGIRLDLPPLKGVSFEHFADRPPEIRINGQTFKPGATIEAVAGEPLRVEVVRGSGDPFFHANPALFADGRLSLDLTKTDASLFSQVKRLDMRADGNELGSVEVRYTPARSAAGNTGQTPVFEVWHNGRLEEVASGQTMQAVEGDQMLVAGVRPQAGNGRAEIINIKGIVTRVGENTGQDADTDVVLDSGLFMPRYLQRGPDGLPRIQVCRETPGARPAAFYVSLAPRRVAGIRLDGPNGQTAMLPFRPGAGCRLQPGTWTLSEAWSNGSQDRLVALVDGLPLAFGESFTLGMGSSVSLEILQAATFKPLGRMTLAPAAMASLATKAGS
ncbi:M14/M99 family metallopeptidase [Desulfovibrio sp. X2]|uniref:M14/M99 family metallopeptidase n=1 Tax=Desulfovibrio sp. X2 TaxID=941449 RepID=UPI0004113DC8|nr:M14/M99 family metallopeptidase [Desulfovibrio sp. X2]